MHRFYLLIRFFIRYYLVFSFFFGYLLVSLYTYSTHLYTSFQSVLPFMYPKDFQNVDTVLAKQFNNKTQNTRILCWVMTQPYLFNNKAQYIKDTWGRYCDTLLFLSSKSDASIPVIAIPVNEGYDTLWGKTKYSLYYIYKHYYDQADWFIKADDDTYVVVENLRYLLNKHSLDKPIYFGRRFKQFLKQGYMSGGAGYVLSKEALRLFVEKALLQSDTTLCDMGLDGPEDLNLAECLSVVGVKPGDSRDEHFLETFHPYTPNFLMIKGLLNKTDWLFQFCYYPLQIVSTTKFFLFLHI